MNTVFLAEMRPLVAASSKPQQGLLTVLGVVILSLGLAAFPRDGYSAPWRTLCHYAEFPSKANSGLVVTVEKEYGKVTGDFLVGFYADGKVFSREWMQAGDWLLFGYYSASKMFFYEWGARYRVDLALRSDFKKANLRVTREYLLYYLGYPIWVSLTDEKPLVDKSILLYLLGCNYY